MENLKKTKIWRKLPPTLDFLVALQGKRQSNGGQTRSNGEMCRETCMGAYTVSCVSHLLSWFDVSSRLVTKWEGWQPQNKWCFLNSFCESLHNYGHMSMEIEV